MKYSEMVELYKKDKLSGEDKEQVEKDIERHEAISNYLYKNEAIPGPDEKGETGADAAVLEISSEEEAKKETEKIIKQIKRRFLSGFVRFGIVLLALVIIAVGVVAWAVPHFNNVEKSRCYSALGSKNSPDFGSDVRLYDNLFAPDKKWDDIKLTDLGGGNYGLSVNSLVPDVFSMYRTTNIDFNSGYYKEQSVSGKISKGVLEMYGENVFSPRASYPFYPLYAGVCNESRLRYGAPVSADKEKLAEAEKNKAASAANITDKGVYNIYVTFDNVYTTEDAAVMFDKAASDGYRESYYMMTLWFAACQKIAEANIYEASTALGFFAANNSINIYLSDFELKSLYYSIINAVEKEGESEDAKKIRAINDSEGVKKSSLNLLNKYFPSVIRRLAENKDFMKLMGCNDIKPYKRVSNSDDYLEDGSPAEGIEYIEDASDTDERYECEAAYLKRFADNIEKNGIFTYGCCCEGVSGKMIKNLAKDPHISYIYIEQMA